MDDWMNNPKLKNLDPQNWQCYHLLPPKEVKKAALK